MPVRRFWILLVCVSAAAAAPAPVSDLSSLQRQAVSLYQAGRYKAAVPLYRRLADAQPDNRGVLKDFLVVLWLGEQYREAAEVGAQLTQLSKKDVEVWFIYARSLLAMGKKEEALSAFRRCRELAPGEKEVQLGEARVAAALRDTQTALLLLLDLKRRYPNFHEVDPELARIQQAQGAYAEAAENWAKAVSHFPENREYRLHAAEALYYSGRPEDAREQLRELAASQPPYWPAIDFLVDDAAARGDWATARQLLESNLTKVELDDEPRLLVLARLYMQEGKESQAISALDRLLALNPKSGKARIMKAACLRSQGNDREAAALYQQVLEMNPASMTALTGLADAENAAGHPDKALQALQKAQTLDPTNPTLLLRQSQYLYENGETRRHREILQEWIQKHPKAPLPALLYHGLTPLSNDPLLAYGLHRSTETFDDHIRALKEAGFHPVTAQQVQAWLQGTTDLPERPVFIAFDDARIDSFQWGDPILKKYDYKATMFVPLVNVEGYFSKFATWKELERYRDTGRWDMQSHGDRAHERIRIDAEGHRGLFLINRRWLADDNQLESEAAWDVRIRRDHDSAKAKIRQRLNRTPQAYSFPEGDFGQEDASNTPQAVPVNLKAVRQAYGSAYHEDDYGFIHRDRDPTLLTRYEPPAGMTGQALLRHFTDHSPAVLMLRQLLRQAAWAGRSSEAHQWLADLQGRGVSQSTLQVEQARIHLADGDPVLARRLAAQAVQADDSAENRQVLDSIDQSDRWRWEGQFAYQEDNQARVSRRFRQDLGYWRTHEMDWSLHQFYGLYSEGAIESVTENGGGLQVASNLGLYHRLALEASGHALSGAADDTYSLSANLKSSWTDHISSELQGGRSIYDSALALQENVITLYGQGILRWQAQGNWRSSLKGRGVDLSDNNNRWTGVWDVGRRVFLPRLWIVGRVLVDDMDRISSNYYSPQLLREIQLGFDFKQRLHKKVDFFVVYLPGYGREDGGEDEFVQDLEAGLNVGVTRSLSFRPSITVIDTPSYHRRTIAGTLVYRF